MMSHMMAGSPLRNSIVALTLLLVPAVVLSHVWNANLYEARIDGLAMLKACTLFLLIIVIVDTPRKLRAMLAAIVAAVFAVTVLSLLQLHGFIDLPALRSVIGRSPDPNNPTVVRLCGVGVFNDPNDFSLVLVTVGIVCVHGLGQRPTTLARMALVVPLVCFGYALWQTHSRGGLISAVAAMLAFLGARFGWRNALPLALVAVPVFLAAFWGRQTSLNLDDPEDTFQARLSLWSDSLAAFRSSPLLGIGQDRLAEVIGQVAHNSYLHAFAELGLFGGAAFIGVFYLVVRGTQRAAPTDPELRRLRPYIAAMTSGYAAGLISLSRCYTVPTQLMLAIATVFMALAARTGPISWPRLDWRCVRRISGLSAMFLAATYVFVRLMLHRR
jgi:O-antigen ligase